MPFSNNGKDREFIYLSAPYEGHKFNSCQLKYNKTINHQPTTQCSLYLSLFKRKSCLKLFSISDFEMRIVLRKQHFYVLNGKVFPSQSLSLHSFIVITIFYIIFM